MLPEIDAEGQQRLSEARVLIIGLGGLGSSSSVYLAAAGVGHGLFFQGFILQELLTGPPDIH